MENISPSSLRLSTVSFDNVFENIFTNIERERKNRIKKLEKLRERRYFDSKSVRKIGVKGDFSYLDEYGKRLEEDMAAFKEITRQREEQETNWTDRPLSPLPLLFERNPVRSPNLSYRLIGNEDYKASRMATMSEMGLNGAMQELYGVESNPYCVPGPEGAAIAAERLSQINERIAKLKVKATEIQQGIHSHMNAGVSDAANFESEQFVNGFTHSESEELVNGFTNSESEELVNGFTNSESEELVNGFTNSESEELVNGFTNTESEELVNGFTNSESEELVNGFTNTESEQFNNTPEIKVTQEDEDEVKE